MRKKITKRILALVLALALCTSLMLPGFAATKPTDSTNHVHNFVFSYREEVYEGGHREAGFHTSTLYYHYVCSYSDCSAVRVTNMGTVPTSHPNPCPTCGWPHP